MRLPRLGTSSVVAAAFIGPGTVLTCATAGLAFGYSLGWTLVFATAAVFVLQSFAAGLGILARRGLGEAIREQITAPTPQIMPKVVRKERNLCRKIFLIPRRMVSKVISGNPNIGSSAYSFYIQFSSSCRLSPARLAD